MQTFITIVHVITCVLLVIVVLLQAGKGAEVSTSFGGSSQTIFGSSGGANFFTKLTSGMAAVFMVTSLVLTIIGGQSRKSVFESIAGNPVSGQTAPQTTNPAAANSESETSKSAATGETDEVIKSDDSSPKKESGAAKGTAHKKR